MKTNFSRPLSSGVRPDTRSYLRRAAFFGAGLLLLYIALQLMPTSTPSAEVTADDAGAVAQSLTRDAGPGTGPGMIIAALILIGGAAFAMFLRKRTAGASPASHLQTIADMPITQDQRIRLVRVRDEVLLLGITSGQITVLQTYAADEFSEGEHPTNDIAISPAFADMLRQAGDRYRNLPRN